MSIASEWRKSPTSPRTYDAKPEVGFDAALKKIAEAVRGRRVTFRVDGWVSKAPDRNFGSRFTLEDLPEVHVEAGTRGETVTVMVDGRDLIELDDGRAVLAKVGVDCRLLGWWQRLLDRVWYRRRFD